MSLGENISALLEKNQLDQKDLAKKLKCAPSCVSDWVNGKTWPRGKKLAKIAKVLGVTTADLVA